MSDFLPQGYQVPASNDKYMKFQPGENRFRVVSNKAITGWEWWTEDSEGKRKPVRIPHSQRIPVEEIDEPDKIKHFWAFVVWNYKEEKIQILEVTQKGIQRTLESLVNDADYGSPRNYDIVVRKTGEGMETRYEVMPKPPKAIDAGVIKLFEDMQINLNALYEGKDPFEATIEAEDEAIASAVDKAGV